MSKPLVRWLHLSDLHIGMNRQSWLWPTLKHLLFDDLMDAYKAVGPWDLVIFSGDLTQAAKREEFDKLDVVLSELWTKFRSMGFSPTLITTPGNHDVKRPSPDDPSVILLNDWWEKDAIRTAFFSSNSNSYYNIITEAFSEYTNWKSRVKNAGDILTTQSALGLIPGDSADVISIGEFRIGVVSLNSAWLQLGDADYKGKLAVDIRQLLSVTNNDPTAWCNANDLNIIVTHHPLDWLNESSQASWRSDINPAGRFDIHLHGHMHEANCSSVFTGGSNTSAIIQGTSLFGLDEFKAGKEKRIVGYSVAKQEAYAESGKLRIWPRKLYELQGGSYKFQPDVSFTLDFHNFYVAREYNRSLDVLNQNENTDSNKASLTPAITENILSKALFFLPNPISGLNIRKLEQQKCLLHLNEKRVFWIVSDWGMGSNLFISTILSQRESKTPLVYRVDISDYTDRSRFFDNIQSHFNCGFETFCEQLSGVGKATLILDDFPPSTLDDIMPERDLELLLEIILDYCPQLTVLIRSRRSPKSKISPYIELKALDEADLKTYVASHERGGAKFQSEDTTAVLFRYTDGAPARVDTALKELEVVSIAELAATNSDIVLKAGSKTQAPPTLIKVVHDLATSSDPHMKGAYKLLKALLLFPGGEQLSRIRRFNGAEAFYPAHASTLYDLGLIDISTTQNIDFNGVDASIKTLFVPRLIRDYVRDQLSTVELKRLYAKAADLYFSPGWASNEIKPPRLYRLNNPHISASDILNATTILLRIVQNAHESSKPQAIAAAIRVSTYVIDALIAGTHNRSVIPVCESILINNEEATPNAGWNYIQFQYAKALRMVGRKSESKIILEEAIERLPKKHQQEANLILALCYESLGQIVEAVEVAHKIIETQPNSKMATQAQSIILEHTLDGAQRDRELNELAKKARKSNCPIVANNIALTLAKRAEHTPELERQILADVLDGNSLKVDFYNCTRAQIRLAAITVSEGKSLSGIDRERLISAYHFLLNERLSVLFNQCHDALWQLFENEDEVHNLLTLFRQSSLFWRLRNEDAREKKYLLRLSAKIGQAMGKDIRNLDKESAYFMIRAGATLIATEKRLAG